MYGVPKYKELKFFKYSKEIMLIVGAIILFFSLSKAFIPEVEEQEVLQSEEVIEEVQPNAYKVVYNGTELGIVYNQEDADKALKAAILQLQNELDKVYYEQYELQFYLEYAEEDAITDVATLEGNIKNTLQADLSNFKTKAYILQIGDDFQVVLRDEEAIKEVLIRAQSIFVNDVDSFDIELEVTPYLENISTPIIVRKQADVEDKELKTTAGEAEAEELPVEEEEGIPTETVGVEFAESIQIIETYVAEDEIVDILIATEMITKENEENKTYKIAKGDTLSEIAEEHNMGLSELMKLNPEVQKQKYLQIGQEVVVTVPEPELSIATKERIVYTEPIKRSTKEVENPNKYAGSSSVLDYGYDGVNQITAILTKVNGYEQGREIVEEQVIKEPKSKVIEIGTKPLPSKGATGSFIYPVVGARITSYFGNRRSGFHHGVDFAIATGTPIRAADGGVVVFSGWKSVYGYTVEIDHGNGILTRYAHCSSLTVKKGEYISKYQEIAKVGNTGRSTGPHVHFEIRFDGIAANPLDYLD